MIGIAQRLFELKQSVSACCVQHERTQASVQLIAVSKFQPVEAIQSAVACGQYHFGENYAQELVQKHQTLNNPAIQWHFIGHLQSNKAAEIANTAHWVHSVDRLKLAQKLNQARSGDLPPLNICLQINLQGEQQKSGMPPESIEPFIQQAAKLDRLSIRGLMIIPKAGLSTEQTQSAFASLRQLQQELAKQYPSLNLDTLSMGMSQDWPLAIAEGASFIRVGTALFGVRPANL